MVERRIEIESERLERALLSHFRGVRMCDCRVDGYTKDDGFIFTATGFATPMVMDESLEAVERLTVELPSEVREAYLKDRYYVYVLNGWTVYTDRQFDIEPISLGTTISRDVTLHQIKVSFAVERQRGTSPESALVFREDNDSTNLLSLLVIETLQDAGIRFLNSGSSVEILPESGGLAPIDLGPFHIRMQLLKNNLGQILSKELWIQPR